MIRVEGLDCGPLGRSISGRVGRNENTLVCLCISTNVYRCSPWFVCIIIYCIVFVFVSAFILVLGHAHACLDLRRNQQSLMLFPSIGWALPSHYTGSTTNQRLGVSVSHNLPLFSLLSLVIFLLHSVRQLPSPSDPQSTLITFSSRVYSISFALLSISLLVFFSLSYLSHSSVLPPPVCSYSLRSPPYWLHIVLCYTFLFFVSFSLVKDLDTEKYVHLVSISSCWR